MTLNCIFLTSKSQTFLAALDLHFASPPPDTQHSPPLFTKNATKTKPIKSVHLNAVSQKNLVT